MTEVHQKIIQEILQEYKNDPRILAINIMGSLSRKEERPDSDIDLEIVTGEEERRFSWDKKEKYGISIDFILSSKGQILYQVKQYPFFLLHKDKNILYDPTGFMVKIKEKDIVYMKEHPEVKLFWENKLNAMKEKKAKGEQKESLREIFDEAEVLFSKGHNITRDWFRK